MGATQVKEASAVFAATAEAQDVPPGYKRTDVGVIPDDWDVAQVRDLCSNIIDYRGRTPRKLGMEWGGGDIPALSARNVRKDRIDLGEETYFGSEELYHRWMTNGDPRKGDIVVTLEAPLGNVAIIPDYRKYILSQRTILLQLNQQRAENGFYFQTFLSQRFQDLLAQNATGSTASGIQRMRFEKLHVVVPPLPEQRAIAEALSDVDGLLRAMETLIAKKRAMKQATMQQLLNAKTRLPGFSGKWETRQLGEVAIIQKGQLITEATLVPGSVPVVAGGKQPAYFHNSANRTRKTITVSASGANAGFVAYWDTPIFASDCSTIGEGTTYSIEFIFYQLVLQQMAIYRAQTGGAQPHVHPNDLYPLIVSVPPLAEQQAIAAVLSAADAEIAALERRLDKTRAIKQGMMQQLLTGRVRLARPAPAESSA